MASLLIYQGFNGLHGCTIKLQQVIIIKNSVDYNDLAEKAKNMRRMVIKMVLKAQTSHVGAALSIVDILAVLYGKILKIDSQNPGDPERDRFILSKGHASTALYAALIEKGVIPEDYLEKYCCNDGKLWGHPNAFSAPGIEFSTGSLGHGLSIGAGLALGGKIDRKNYRAFVLLGDGECNEGQVWEAAMFAAQHKLDNLVAIIDYNKLQGFGRGKEIISMEPFTAKWQSFGWHVKEINGHILKEIDVALSSVPLVTGKPTVIIAHTVKGKGVSFMEDKLEWHYKSPNAEQAELALKEIDQK